MILRNAILGLLQYAPMSGYTLKKVFEMSIKHIWEAKLSQIYRELGIMEAEGLVTSSIKRQETRPDKKIYTITKEGIVWLNRWLSEFPVKFGPPKRDEFMLRIFFASRMDKKLIRKEFDEYIHMIEKYKTAININEIDSFSNILLDSGGDKSGNNSKALIEKEAVFWKFTVRRFKYVSEANIRWAKECLNELED
jgi:PadR family transcriptional regulator, regulatory protein AphA